MQIKLNRNLEQFVNDLIDNEITEIIPKKWNKVTSMTTRSHDGTQNAYVTEDNIHAYENCILLRKSDMKLFYPVIIDEKQFMLCGTYGACVIDPAFINDDIMFLFCVPTRCGYGVEVEIDGVRGCANDEKYIELNTETKKVTLV